MTKKCIEYKKYNETPRKINLIWFLIIWGLVLILLTLAWIVFTPTNKYSMSKVINTSVFSIETERETEALENKEKDKEKKDKEKTIEEKNNDKDVDDKDTENNTKKYSKSENIIDEYFFSVNKGDCTRAIEIRPKYQLDACKKKNGKIDIANVKIDRVKDGKKIAVVFVSVPLTKKGTKLVIDKDEGHFLLKKKKGKWLIDKYISIYTLTEKKFLEQYFLEKEAEPDWWNPNKKDPLSNIGNNTHSNFREQTIWSDKKNNSGGIDLEIETDESLYHSFGSSKILALWSKKALYGNPAKDKKVRRNRSAPALNIPPRRKEPYKHWEPLPHTYRNSIRYINTKEKIVALTFDLCEREKETTGYDGAIVNYLRKNNIQATFYAGGKWMRSHKDKTQQLMADPLFEIGNHAWTHGNMRVLKGQDMRDQILWTQAQYEILRDDLQGRFNLSEKEMKKIQPIPKSFRFPYGTCSRESLDTLAELGLPAIQWNIVTADPAKGQTGKGISRAILRKVKPGSIIIAHANGRGHGTEDSLPRFIPQLIKRGYKFVTVSELLASSNTVKATRTCYEEKPGDNKRYDRIFGKGTE